jgi:hypothetical protein
MHTISGLVEGRLKRGKVQQGFNDLEQLERLHKLHGFNPCRQCPRGVAVDFGPKQSG